MKEPAITGLITAAGLSGRMGSFKPLRDFEGEPFIVSITRKILKQCNKVIIVTGFKTEEIVPVINEIFADKNVMLVFNPDYEKGMFTSLQKGIKEAADYEWILYHFVDQPFFTEKFYSDLVSQMNVVSDWIQPAYGKREGHPILFNRKVSQLILDYPCDSNLRVIKENPSIAKSRWICDYPEVLTDFDTEENIKEYYRAKK